MALSFAENFAAKLHDKGGAVYNVKHPDFGATGDGTTDDRAAFVAAEAAGDHGFVPAGTYSIASNLTLSKAWTFARGAKIKPASGVTITFEDMPDAGRYTIFDTSAGGSISFGFLKITPRVFPEWWGARGDQSTSAAVNAAAFLAAATALPNYGGVIDLAAGYYRLSAFAIARDHVAIEGVGATATVLRFEATTGTCVKWDGASGAPIQYLVLRNLRIFGDATNATPGDAIALDIEYIENCILDNVRITGFYTGIRGSGVYGLRIATELVIEACVRGVYGFGTQWNECNLDQIREMDAIGTTTDRFGFLCEVGIANTRIGGTFTSGIRIAPSATYGGNLESISFAPGTKILSPANHALSIDGQNAAVAYGISTVGVQVDGGSRGGIAISYCRHVTVAANQVRNIGTTAFPYAFYIQNCTDGVIEGNLALDDQGVPTLVHGFWMSNNTRVKFARSNRSRGHTSSQMRSAGNSACYIELEGTYAADANIASNDWAVGDTIHHTTPAVDANNMVHRGWICVTAGAPGTWNSQYVSTVSPAT